jgi:hypothetical protein
LRIEPAAVQPGFHAIATPREHKKTGTFTVVKTGVVRPEGDQSALSLATYRAFGAGIKSINFEINN